jgi:Protein of unknown function (DUF3987)
MPRVATFGHFLTNGTFMSNDTISNFPQQQLFASSNPLLSSGQESKFQEEIDHDIFLSNQRASDLERSYEAKRKGSRKKSLPLQRTISEPEPYPFQALGNLLGPAALRIHEVVKAPDSICGQSLLAAASLITQAYGDIHIDGRIHPISLFCLTVGESGDRKSAVDTIALKPIRDYEKMLVSTYKEEKRIFKNRIDTWKKKRQEILNQCSIDHLENQLNDLEKEPEPPLEPNVLLEEPTYEGLIKLLALGQPSVGLFTDEGGRMIGGYAMNGDNMLKTACGLSSLWDGKPVTRIRGAKDENLILYGRRFSMHLMVQENIFSKIQQNELLTGQGLMARCLITHAQTNAGNRPYQEVDLCKDPYIMEYWKKTTEHLDLPFPLNSPDIRNELHPKSICLDSGAKEIWKQFHDEIERGMKEDGSYRAIRRTGSKAAEQTLRIAGVLALFENADTTIISMDVIERSIALMRYYLNEAIRIMELGLIDPDLELAQKTMEWMKKNAVAEPKKIFHLQEIYQSGPREIRKKTAALKIMKILADHGQVFQSAESASAWQLWCG